MTIKKRGGGELVVGWGLCWVGGLGWVRWWGVGVVRMYSLVLKEKRALSQKRRRNGDRANVRRNTNILERKLVNYFLANLCAVYGIVPETSISLAQQADCVHMRQIFSSNCLRDYHAKLPPPLLF